MIFPFTPEIPVGFCQGLKVNIPHIVKFLKNINLIDPDTCKELGFTGFFFNLPKHIRDVFDF